MIQVANLHLSAGGRALISGLSFSVSKGFIAGLQAPSGSGKSMLLRWMLGALPEGVQASGELSIDQRDLQGLPTEQRRIGLMLQQAALFPHLSVAGNLNLALPRCYKGSERSHLVSAQLANAGLAGFESRDPATLSGGERARVALLRTLMAEPVAILLDEPFSSLDAALRSEFRSWVYEQIRAQNIPALVVSHDDQDLEAVDLRLSLKGELIQTKETG